MPLDAAAIALSSRHARAVPPGPRLPRVLQLLNWVRRPLPFMEECARAYGDCFTIGFPTLPGARGIRRPTFVFFSDSDAVREIFTADRVNAGEANAFLEPLLGQHSLLLLDGARHLRERRMMQPPFHGERMQAYGDVMREVTDRVVGDWSAGRSFPIHPEMQRITLEVILRTVFGVDEGPRLVRLRDLLTQLLTLAANPWIMILQVDLGPLTPWGKLLRLGQELDEMLFAEMARRRAAGLEGRDDVLSMLLAARDEDGRPMTDEELRDEMVTLLVAGHETTATSLAWAFHHILEHPEVRDRVLQELERVTGGGPLLPRHVPELEYLDATVKETLRLNPIIPVVGRRLQEPMRIGGRDLPAGVIAVPCIYLTHRREDLWQHPTRFDPERFLGARTSPYAFFPFGGGVRRCLGMAFALYEMKIVLAQVLMRATLGAAPGHTVRVVRRSITLAPSGGMPVVMHEMAA
jgi:cytochrome P450